MRVGYDRWELMILPTVAFFPLVLDRAKAIEEEVDILWNILLIAKNKMESLEHRRK